MPMTLAESAIVARRENGCSVWFCVSMRPSPKRIEMLNFFLALLPSFSAIYLCLGTIPLIKQDTLENIPSG
jgi:hypothetical protein